MNDLGVHPFQETSIIHILICSSLRPTFCDFTTCDCHEGRRRPLPFWQHCSSSSQCNHDMNTAFALSLYIYICICMILSEGDGLYIRVFTSKHAHTHTCWHIYIYVYTHMIRYKYIFERIRIQVYIPIAFIHV